MTVDPGTPAPGSGLDPALARLFATVDRAMALAEAALVALRDAAAEVRRQAVDRTELLGLQHRVEVLTADLGRATEARKVLEVRLGEEAAARKALEADGKVSKWAIVGAVVLPLLGTGLGALAMWLLTGKPG